MTLQVPAGRAKGECWADSGCTLQSHMACTVSVVHVLRQGKCVQPACQTGCRRCHCLCLIAIAKKMVKCTSMVRKLCHLVLLHDHKEGMHVTAPQSQLGKSGMSN